jgi:hypothetical protein
MIVKITLRMLLAGSMLLAGAAEAQLFRAYLASDGNDANACTLAAPCRLLPRALAAVASGGEIWILDSANFNTGEVVIDKPVSIQAIPGARGSLLATGGGNAVRVEAGGGSVALRNLTFVGLGSNIDAIVHISGSHLDIRECEIVGVQRIGIFATAPAARVNVVDTVIRRVGQDGIVAQNGTVLSLNRSQVTGNPGGMLVSGGAVATIVESRLAGNFSYNVLARGLSGPTYVSIEASEISGGNQAGLKVEANGTGDHVEVMASRSAINGNQIGVSVYRVDSATAKVVLSDNTITNNSFAGVQLSGSPTVLTRGNNSVTGNGQDLIGGTLAAAPTL